MSGSSWVEWACNVLMCLCVWGGISLFARFLQARKLWNDVMTVACFLWVLSLRFRHPAAVLVPVVVFALGLFQALGSTRYNVPVRIVGAILGALIWFRYVMWNLIAVMFYFCSGCFFSR